VNKVIISGNTGADIIERKFENDTLYCYFDVADASGYTGKDGKWVKQVTWHHCRITGNLTKTMVNKIGKGSTVVVEGKLVDTKKENGKDLKQVVYVNNIEFLNFKAPATAVAGTADNAVVIAELIKGGMSLAEAKKAIAGDKKKPVEKKKAVASAAVVDDSDAIPFDE